MLGFDLMHLTQAAQMDTDESDYAGCKGEVAQLSACAAAAPIVMMHVLQRKQKTHNTSSLPEANCCLQRVACTPVPRQR